MIFAITTTRGHCHETVMTGFDCKESAENYARNTWAMICFEHDADHLNCADFFTACGQVMSIGPVTAEILR